jgi:hypothetical protein
LLVPLAPLSMYRDDGQRITPLKVFSFNTKPSLLDLACLHTSHLLQYFFFLFQRLWTKFARAESQNA